MSSQGAHPGNEDGDPWLLVGLLLTVLGVLSVAWMWSEWFGEPPVRRATLAECLAGQCDGKRVRIEGALVPGSVRRDAPGCAGALSLQLPGGGQSVEVCSSSLEDVSFHCGDDEMKRYMELGYLHLLVEGTLRKGTLHATTLSVRAPCNPKSYRFRYGTPAEILERRR